MRFRMMLYSWILTANCGRCSKVKELILSLLFFRLIHLVQTRQFFKGFDRVTPHFDTVTPLFDTVTPSHISAIF